MKTKFKQKSNSPPPQRLSGLILTIMLALSIHIARAQFEPATVNSRDFEDCTTTTVSAADVENTGSDYIRYNAGSNLSVTATVWDGNRPVLAYHHISGATIVPCILDIASGLGYTVVDPDVSLFYRKVSTVDYLFAIVCFRDDATDRIYLELFEFDFTPKTFSSLGVTYLFTSVNNTAVNIDSDQFEHWVITFDHETSATIGNEIYYVAGKWKGSPTFQPTICQSATVLPDQDYPAGGTISRPYVKPDVCVYASSNSLSTAAAVFTFIADNGDVLVTELQQMTDLCTPTSLGTTADYTITAASGYTIDWPRIASHKDQSSFSYLQDGYCVVYEYYDASLNEIQGLIKFTDYTTPSSPITTFTQRIYTDGMTEVFYNTTQTLPDINDIADYINSKPVVTYDAKSGNVEPVDANGNPIKSVIAWNVTEVATGNVFPVALYIENAYGQPWTDLGVPSPVYLFLEVPDPLTDNQHVISLAAEQSPKFLYTWFDEDESEMEFKRVNPGLHLKISSGFENSEALSFTDLENLVNNHQITEWQLYRMDGALVFSSRSNKPGELDFKNLRLPPGIYLAKFLTTGNEISISRILKY